MNIDSLFKTAAQSAAESSSPYAAAAAFAARTETLALAAASGLASVNYSGTGQSVAGRPQLTPPATPSAGAEANFIAVMASLAAQLDNFEGHKRARSLNQTLELFQARQNGLAQLSEHYAAAVEALAAAEADVAVSHEQLAQAQARVAHTYQQLRESDERLSGLQPGTPEHDAELVVQQQLRTQLRGAEQHLRTTLEQHRLIVATADQAASKVQDKAAQVQQAGVGGDPLKAISQRLLDVSAQALLLRLQTIDLLGESAQEAEQFSRDLFQALQKQVQEHMQVESDKYLEETRKAEAAEKTGNCLSKILGPLIAVVATIVGVVVAAVSGGALAGVAAALIGVALLASEKLVEHTTGVSIMGEVTKPLMAVMQEAIKLFTKIYAEVLKGVGIFSEKTAQRIAEIGGMIAGIFATIAAVALAAMAAGAALGPVISKVAAKIGEMISKMLPTLVQTLQQAASTVGSSLTQALGKLSKALGLSVNKTTASLYATRAEMALAVVEVGSVAAQSTFQVKGAAHQRQAADRLAEVELSRSVNEAITQYMGELLERFGEWMRAREKEVEQVLQDLQKRGATSQQMARNI
ncbi:type III secretion system translocon subunit SctE [Pseudomonas sp. SBB6]|uniref:type III secretion system translocon subunit SctE n=1 Tax=Pseudomonas sp. SBB6 TaxID=2962032 RepID=UPI0020B8B9FD|nr:type III secretion system translocon subunit SctE [Pseudomonas sp. SBB6]